jgi:hypothetical protein
LRLKRYLRSELQKGKEVFMDKKPDKSKFSPLADVKNISGTPQSTDVRGRAAGMNESVAAVSAFNRTAAAGGGVGGGGGPSEEDASVGEEQGGEEEEGEREESLSGQTLDENSFLSEQELVDILNLKARVDANYLVMMQQKDMIEYQQSTLDRAKQLEERLEAPKIREFIQRGFVSQDIPIQEGVLELTVRSIPSRVDRLVKDLAYEELTDWEFAKVDSDTQLSVLQLYRLAVGVESINGMRPWPNAVSDIYQIVKSRERNWRKEATSRIKENFEYWDMAEGAMATQCSSQFETFMFRIRKQLDTLGLEKAVGN